MYLIVGGRSSGKTYSMFQYCDKNNIPLLTGNKKSKDSLKRYAKELGFNVQIYTIVELNYLKTTEGFDEKVCIDDIEQFLHEAYDLKIDRVNANPYQVILLS
ncbi:TPA: hypothetical protein IWJ17_001695 [Enterococcus faecium]|nr:hypothetical protein [Enterococcus faecium]